MQCLQDCINLPEPKEFPAIDVEADTLLGYLQDFPQLKYQKAGIADMNHSESEEEPSESEAEVESPMSPAHESSIQAEFGDVLPTYVCKHCNYSCKEHCRLVTHVLQRHTSKEKTQTCSYCPYATNRTDILKIHIQRHIGERPFKCIECTYAANSTAHLNRHQLTHTGERPVELRVEENIDLPKPKDRILFRDADPFLGHSLDLSNISYKEAEISIQNSENNVTDHDHYKFEKEPSESEAAIESHMSPVPEHSSHEEMVVQMVVNENDSSSPIESPPHPSSRSSGERQKRRACTCPNCKANGGVPMEGPDKRKMHLCHYPKCAKTYGKTTHLHDHLRRHENERPFGCDFVSCEKRFTRSDELQRHRRTHTGKKRFVCEQCHKGFIRSDHLTKHVKIHGGISAPDLIPVLKEESL